MYHIIKKIMLLAMRPFLRKVEGLHHIPHWGGAVLTANHASYFDHFIIGTQVVNNLNRQLYFLAKKEHFDNPVTRVWHDHLKAIPLDRRTGGREALIKAEEILKEGHLVMIYPEGTRTLDKKLKKGKPGAAKLALSARVPVIPIGLTNTFEILPKGRNWPRLGKRTDMIVGEPMHFDSYYGQEIDKESLQIITTQIMERIAQLAGMEYDGE